MWCCHELRASPGEGLAGTWRELPFAAWPNDRNARSRRERVSNPQTLYEQRLVARQALRLAMRRADTDPTAQPCVRAGEGQTPDRPSKPRPFDSGSGESLDRDCRLVRGRRGLAAHGKRRAIYLASNEAAFVDRTVIVVDGARRSVAVIAGA
jgi:hypothetical protein